MNGVQAMKYKYLFTFSLFGAGLGKDSNNSVSEKFGCPGTTPQDPTEVACKVFPNNV